MKRIRLNRVVLATAVGFGVVLFIIAADEIFDLPHLIFNVLPTPVNWAEIGIEAVVVLLVGLFTVSWIWRLSRKAERAEDARRGERDYLDNLLNYANAPIIVWGTDSRIRRFNRGFEHLAGYTAGEVIGRELTMLFPQASRDESLTKIARTLRGEYWESVEAPILRKDGHVRLALWNSANIYAEDGTTLLATIAQGQDITERKRVEEKIEHLNLVLRAIRNVNQIITTEKNRESLLKGVCDRLIETRGYYNAWVALIDEAGRVVTAAETGLGGDFLPVLEKLKRGELTACGQKALSQSGVVVIEDPASTCADCPLSAKYGGRGAMTVRLEHEGKVYGLLSVSIPRLLIAEEEEQTLFQEVARDIAFALHGIEMEEERKGAEEKLKQYSERLEEMVKERTKELKDAQEQLIRKEKLATLGQLAGGVGHELRNPLGVISNAVYFLQMTLPEADETTREYLEVIRSEVGNADKIVSDLLDFSRTRLVEREEAAVSHLVAEVLEKKPPPQGVEVTTELPSDLPSVFVDDRQIGQVLLNLVTNAYQAMPEGGELTIGAKAEKEAVHLSIADTGCGIPRENMEKLFEPLFATKARGIGLGLAVSRNLVEANGGSIKVESEEGKGSTFTVVLPRKEVAS